MIVYISGPITGLPGLNKTAFDSAAAELKAVGFEPIVPHEITAPGDTWEEAMRSCIRAMMDADAVVMLRGWEGSKGAKIEYDLARAVGIPVHHHFLDLKNERKAGLV